MTAKERDVVRGNNKWKGSVAGLGGLSGPAIFCSCCVYTLCLFGMSFVFQTCLGVCELWKVGRRRVLPFEGILRLRIFQRVESLLCIRAAGALNCFSVPSK